MFRPDENNELCWLPSSQIAAGCRNQQIAGITKARRE